MQFSIITPSYMQSDWLVLASASVADQDGVEAEHIIQDAGTPNVEVQFQSEPSFSRAKLFVEKDKGMYDAINRGMNRARGTICGYLNCDEQYLPGTLSKVEKYFRAHPALEVLFGDAVLVNAEGHPLSYRRAIAPVLSHLRLADLNTLTCATFFRRHLIEKGHRFPTHLKIAGDQYWIFQLLKAGVKMAAIPEPLSIFTFTGDNLSQSKQASVEKFGWLPQGERPRRWLTPLVVAWHRFRKLLAGAYRTREVTIEIFTRDNPRTRRRIRGKVGFRWPQ